MPRQQITNGLKLWLECLCVKDKNNWAAAEINGLYFLAIFSIIHISIEYTQKQEDEYVFTEHQQEEKNKFMVHIKGFNNLILRLKHLVEPCELEAGMFITASTMDLDKNYDLSLM